MLSKFESHLSSIYLFIYCWIFVFARVQHLSSGVWYHVNYHYLLFYYLKLQGMTSDRLIYKCIPSLHLGHLQIMWTDFRNLCSLFIHPFLSLYLFEYLLIYFKFQWIYFINPLPSSGTCYLCSLKLWFLSGQKLFYFYSSCCSLKQQVLEVIAERFI